MDEERKRSPVPPPFAERMLGLLYSDRRAFTHLGDFAEVYGEIAGKRGTVVARLWYGGQILKSIPGFILARFYWSAVMLRNYVLISLRNMARDKGPSLINVGGLAVGMACFLLILSFVRFETGFDRFHDNADRIYRVIGESKSGAHAYISDALAPALRDEIPGIERVTELFRPFGEKTVLQADQGQFFQAGLFADAGFLEVFSFSVVRGGRRGALEGPSKIALTEATARKLFGRQDPIGKTVVWKGDESRELIVTAVLEDIAANSHLRFDYLISLDTLRADKNYGWMFNHWGTLNFPIYLELSEAATKESVEEAISAWLSQLSIKEGQSRPFGSYRLQALTDIHLGSNFKLDIAETGDLRSVRMFMAIAILVLLIACVNTVNLATARSSARAREIGIRKVTGAHRAQIFQQFLGESLLVASLAGGLALGFIAVALPLFNNLAGVPLRLKLVGGEGILPWLAGTVLFVALAAGTYPSAVLSALQPVRTLRDFSPSGRKSSFLRSLLVVSQFTASVGLIAATLVVSGQMRYVRSTRLGFNREHVVVITAFERETGQKMPVIKAELERRPEVIKASLTSGLPTDIGQGWMGFRAKKGDGTEIKFDLTLDYVDENFLDVFEIALDAGRNFRPGDKDAIILNQTALREIGWSEPVGKKVEFGKMAYEVVGIIEDFHFASLHNRIGPMALFYESGRHLAVRIRPGDVTRTLGVLRSVFEKNTAGQPFDFFFLDDAFDALYRREIRTGEIFSVFAGLAVLIACLGLFGLSSFNVARRTKEIGVRKIMGASVSRLVLLLNRDILRPVVLGNLTAWPLAYVVMNRWLRNFAYRISLGPKLFLLASLVSLLVALAVVGGKTMEAASANPAESLRHE